MTLETRAALPASHEAAVPQAPTSAARRALDIWEDTPRPAVNSLMQAFTLALWMGCLAVGTLGGVMKYPRPEIKPPELPPVESRTIRVELSPPENLAPLPQPAQTSAKHAPDPPPPLPREVPVPAAAQLVAVAAPSPLIRFAIPVQGPVREAAPKFAAPPPRSPASVASLEHLRFGIGEGAQPDPEYPDAAKNAAQQGTVGVSWTVTEQGKVTDVRVFKPSRWPLLNEAAARAVRDKFRYGPGPVRHYDILIEFRLN